MTYNDVTRRMFLKSLSHLATVAGVSSLVGGILGGGVATGAPEARRLYAYGDEGRMLTDSIFTVGFLYTEDPGKHFTKIRDLRKKHRYYRPFAYDSTDKFKVSYGEDLINYLISAPDLRFIARVKGKSFSTKEYLYSRTLSQLSPQKLDLSLILAAHREERRERRIVTFHENLKGQITRLKQITAVRHLENDLIQLSDFLTGSVALDAAPKLLSRTDCRHNCSGHSVKIGLLETLKGHLKVSSLLDDSLQNGEKFKVIYVP